MGGNAGYGNMVTGWVGSGSNVYSSCIMRHNECDKWQNGTDSLRQIRKC
jgi:hypothetical protein